MKNANAGDMRDIRIAQLEAGLWRIIRRATKGDSEAARILDMRDAAIAALGAEPEIPFTVSRIEPFWEGVYWPPEATEPPDLERDGKITTLNRIGPRTEETGQ